LTLLAYLEPFPSAFVYFIDTDTNGEVDFSSTQLPFTALACCAAVLTPTAAITLEPRLEPIVDASAPLSSGRQRATNAS
jgi:hypothetical protein